MQVGDLVGSYHGNTFLVVKVFKADPSFVEVVSTKTGKREMCQKAAFPYIYSSADKKNE